MKRRDLLKTALAGSSLIAASGCASDTPDGNNGDSDERGQPNFDPGRLTNEPWAREVMRDAGVDGLVAMSSVNVFYLTNYQSFLSKMQVPYANFGIFPRDENRQPALVTSSVDQWAVSNSERGLPTCRCVQHADRLGTLYELATLVGRTRGKPGVRFDLAVDAGRALRPRTSLACGRRTIARLTGGITRLRPGESLARMWT